MTEEQFQKAKAQLARLSMDSETMHRMMRDAIRYYAQGEYSWGMTYQFHFLYWQDEVKELRDKLENNDAHKLWYLIGGRL
jgi:hypothetical protein